MPATWGLTDSQNITWNFSYNPNQLIIQLPRQVSFKYPLTPLFDSRQNRLYGRKIKHRLFLLFYYHSKNSTLKCSSILRVSIFPLWNNYCSKRKGKDVWPNRRLVEWRGLSICSWEKVQRCPCSFHSEEKKT